MGLIGAATAAQLDPAMDEISLTVFKSWDELFGMDRPAVEAFQLKAVKQRLEKLAPLVSALRNQMEEAGVTGIQTLDDVVPLLFPHTTYKSYPVSLIERSRFDHLTRWLSSVTSIDLSGVDASKCEGIDDWLGVLERCTPLLPFHTSGTTGKLSFYPRTTTESDLWSYHFIKLLQGFGNEPGIKLGFDGVRLPAISAAPKTGRFATQRLNVFLARYVSPTPEQTYTMTGENLSADLQALSGRVRMAQAKGELSSLTLTEGMRAALKRYIADQERGPQDVGEFFESILGELRGKRVFICGLTTTYLDAALYGASRGLHDVFDSTSLMTTGGGGKGTGLPPDWLEQIIAFTGIKDTLVLYGMTETTGMMKMCKEGYYHIPPVFIVYLLDPQTGALLPRTGTQTGRFACMDLLPSTYWGGIISGDKVTVEWDRECPCGRKGAHIHRDITRYSEAITGDDKISCAATIDNTDASLQQLLGL
jgi:hypothetical protein